MNIEGDVTMHCPGCKRAFEMNLKDLSPGKTKTCEGCGETITFTGDDMRKGAEALKKIRDSIEAIKKAAHRSR